MTRFPRWYSVRAEILLALLALCACVTDDGTRRIRPEETTWIQRGQTTRDEITAKFGQPSLTLTEQEEGGLSQYAEYRPSPSQQAYGQRGGSQVLEPIPQGPFPQVYPSAQQSGLLSDELQPLGDRFWLRYDAHGFVTDFGFGVRPTRKK